MKETRRDMTTRYLTVVAALVILMAGCTPALNNSQSAERCTLAGVINQRNAVQYAMNGEHAKARDSWDITRRVYAQAVVNARLAEWPDKKQAAISYEYGRSLGVTCFFDPAETYLIKAYDLDKKTGHPLHMSLVELARLMLDQEKYSQATEYFQSALKELDQAEFYKRSPADSIAYADFLDEYALVLSKSDKNSEAASMKKRASEIRSKYPDQASLTERTPYGKYCIDPSSVAKSGADTAAICGDDAGRKFTGGQKSLLFAGWLLEHVVVILGLMLR